MALTLQMAALLVLALALLGTSWLDTRGRPRVLVLVDRSHSVPREAGNRALADVVRASKSAGAGALQVIEFADRPASAFTLSDPAASANTGAALDRSATNIEAALQAALAAHARSAFGHMVVISDGHETSGDTGRALHGLQDAGLPLHWIAVGRPPPAVRVAQVLAPDRVLLGQRIQLSVQLAGALDQPLRIRATLRSPGGATQSGAAEAATGAPVALSFEARQAGAALVDVVLEDPASGQVLVSVPDAAVVDVAPRAAVLYAQGATGTLARSLLAGGWALDVVPAARLDAQADALGAYQAVVLEDVAIADASPRFWQALVSAVQARGLGLLVLGGPRSFARGGYRGSALESVLPLLSEPAALDQPASIVFVVDKSGSMGQGSGGVDRFQLAQRAVLETAQGLGARDALGLVVFDVVPRVLIPLGPAPAGIQALARGWPASPGGGTRLAPALDAAIDVLERSGDTRRLLVLVTDGFVDEAPVAALRTRLAGARIETLALAVGPEADVNALQGLVGAPSDPGSGQVLRVGQAADLPQMMRAGLERRRARLERGTIAVEQRQALPFPPGTLTGWPAVAAHHVSRAQPQAVVAVQSQRGDPLIAFQQAGHGRVVAISSGLGAWTPQWLAWREWPGLAGGLADWIQGAGPGAAGTALTVTDLPDGLQVEADTDTDTNTATTTATSAAAGPGRPAPGGLRIVVDTPKAAGRALSTEATAPGRLRATLPDDGPGLYTFVLSTAHGTRRQLHLRRALAEDTSFGLSPALATWRAAGLLRDWAPDSLTTAPARQPGPGQVDRGLIVLALALFLSGVLVDRGGPGRAGLRAGLHAAAQRWRRRA